MDRNNIEALESFYIQMKQKGSYNPVLFHTDKTRVEWFHKRCKLLADLITAQKVALKWSGFDEKCGKRKNLRKIILNPEIDYFQQLVEERKKQRSLKSQQEQTINSKNSTADKGQIESDNQLKQKGALTESFLNQNQNQIQNEDDALAESFLDQSQLEQSQNETLNKSKEVDSDSEVRCLWWDVKKITSFEQETVNLDKSC